jgi:hypothetical protein
MKYGYLGLILVIPTILVACNLVHPATPLAATATIGVTQPTALSPTAQSDSTSQPTPNVTMPAHRIGVRVVNGVGEFYDRQSGQKFIPRGSNYVRLAQQTSESGDTIVYHSTFNVGLYDADRTESALRKMHADGYNIVRVFLNGCCVQNSLGDPAGGLSAAYIKNLADFIHRAKANDIFVLITTDGPPATGGYTKILDSTWSEDFAGNSVNVLRTGGLRAEAQFWRDLIQALVEQQAPLENIFAYQLRNELFFDSNLPPFTLTSGRVNTANGSSYDMASPDDKQRMMDEGLVYWIDSTRAEILKLDPTALVTVGFFWPQKPHPARIGDPRVIETRPAIWQSSADFIDLHPYPGVGLTFPQFVDNFGIEGMQEKPILMGEFGASTSSFPTLNATARVLHDWQVESCKYGFDGWLVWTWDTQEDPNFYTALSGEGQIEQALAPANRPDACQAGDFPFFEHNLALGAKAQASRFLPDQPPSGAVDGDTNKWWGAGASPPQWIQIDLGKPATIGLIRLVVTQSPSGDTLHQVWTGPAAGQLKLIHTFKGYTYDNQVLEFKPDAPLQNVRVIKVVTSQSPSWVGWKEIEVLESK